MIEDRYLVSELLKFFLKHLDEKFSVVEKLARKNYSPVELGKNLSTPVNDKLLKNRWTTFKLAKKVATAASETGDVKTSSLNAEANAVTTSRKRKPMEYPLALARDLRERK